MVSIQKSKALFGDFYYNSSSKEIKEYTELLSKYSIDEIDSLLKNLMQDILAHLLGCNNFMDSIMFKGGGYLNYTFANHSIGKRKLTEFFCLLEEIEKSGVSIDEIKFLPNQLDKILSQERKSSQSYLRRYLSYLSFENLAQFFEQVIKILEIKPMVRDIYKDRINPMIPRPSSFDFNHYYYDCINTLDYLGDEQQQQDLKEKYHQNGEIIDARNWIRAYQQRFKIVDTNNVKEDFSREEKEKLNRKAKEQKENIEKLKLALISARPIVSNILAESDINVSEEDLDELENNYIFDKLAKSAEVSIRIQQKDSLKNKLYAAIIATVISISMNSIDLVIPNLNDNTIKIEQSDEIGLNQYPEKDIKDDEMYTDTENTDTQEQTEIYREFKLGEEVNPAENNLIYYYNSATSNEPQGIMKKPGIIVGYFAVISNGEEKKLIASCRNQKEVEQFMQQYNGDMDEISWRCAVNNTGNEEIKKMIESGQEIPWGYTTCFIDYEIQKENVLKGGK